MLDRAQQALHWLGLDPIAETVQDVNSYGFRRERSCADALEQVFNVFGKGSSPGYALEGDIEKCFDHTS
jgi:RNA-directed DNA polymerase